MLSAHAHNLTAMVVSKHTARLTALQIHLDVLQDADTAYGVCGLESSSFTNVLRFLLTALLNFFLL